MYWLQVVYIYSVLNFIFLKKNVRLCNVDIHFIFLKFIPFWELKINVKHQNISQIVSPLPLTKKSKTKLHFPKDTAISRIHGCNPDRLLELSYHFCTNTVHYNVAFPKDKKYQERRFFFLMNWTQQSLPFWLHKISTVLGGSHLNSIVFWVISPVRWRRSEFTISSTQGCHTQFTAGKKAKKGHGGQCQTPTTVDYRDHWRSGNTGNLNCFFSNGTITTKCLEKLKSKIFNSITDIMWFSDTASFVTWTWD